MSLLVLFSICVNLSHLRIPSEKLASFVTLFFRIVRAWQANKILRDAPFRDAGACPKRFNNLHA
jgi:hypothetical protein